MECFAHILSRSQKDFVRVRLYDVKGVTNYEHECDIIVWTPPPIERLLFEPE